MIIIQNKPIQTFNFDHYHAVIHTISYFNSERSCSALIRTNKHFTNNTVGRSALFSETGIEKPGVVHPVKPAVRCSKKIIKKLLSNCVGLAGC